MRFGGGQVRVDQSVDICCGRLRNIRLFGLVHFEINFGHVAERTHQIEESEGTEEMRFRLVDAVTIR